MVESALRALNIEIMLPLQEAGIAAVSDTTVKGRHCLGGAIRNHRARREDLDLLVIEVLRLGTQVAGPLSRARAQIERSANDHQDRALFWFIKGSVRRVAPVPRRHHSWGGLGARDGSLHKSRVASEIATQPDLSRETVRLLRRSQPGPTCHPVMIGRSASPSCRTKWKKAEMREV